MPTETSLPPVHAPAAASPAPAGEPAASGDSEVSLMDILIILAGRKRTILWLTAAFAVLAICISLVLPKRYTATVTLLPPQQNSSISAGLAAQLGSLGNMASLAGGSLGLKNPNDMYVAMFRSRTVEDAMVQRFALMKEYRSRYPSDARLNFEGHSEVSGSGKDNLIHISVYDRDPNRAAELANGYVNEFRALSEHLAITEASQRRLFFEQQLEQAKNNLANAEEAMKETEQKTGVIQLDSQARALIESAAALRAQIMAKEVQIQSLRTFATSENSQLVQAQQELDSLRTELVKLGGSESAASTDIVVPKGRVTEAGLEYVRRLRDVKYWETIFEILARQFEMAKLDEAKQGALIQVVDAAIPPDRWSFPKRSLIVIAATVVGFILGLVVVLIQAGFERVNSDRQMANKIKLLRSLLWLRRPRLHPAP